MTWSKITAFVLAIISIFLAITMYASTLVIYIAPLSIVFSIVSIVLINNYNKENPDNKESKALSIASIIISSIAIIITIIIIVLRIVFAAAFEDYYSESMDDSAFGGFFEGCSETIDVGESTKCIGITVEYNDLEIEDNTYAVTYTITNNGIIDFEFLKKLSATIEYEDFGSDFAQESGYVFLEPGESMQLTSTFETDEQKQPEKVEINLDNGSVYLEV